MEMQVKMEDLLQEALEFGDWADGLKMSIDAQFKSFEERIMQLMSDNNFLMNRLTPLISMEKAAFDGQTVTRVLVAEADLEILKTEVLQYTQKLWSHASSMFEERLEQPISKFKMWFEAPGDQNVRNENEVLKRTVEDLKQQLEVERKVALVHLEFDTKKFGADMKVAKQDEKQDAEQKAKPDAKLDADKGNQANDEEKIVNGMNDA